MAQNRETISIPSHLFAKLSMTGVSSQLISLVYMEYPSYPSLNQTVVSIYLFLVLQWGTYLPTQSNRSSDL